MAAGGWTLFNSFRLKDGDGTLGNLNGATDYKISLHVAGSGAPVVTATDYNAVKLGNTEVANGAGGIYVTGGVTVTPSEYIVHPTDVAKTRFNVPNAAWTTSGSAMAARYAVLRKSTGDHIIAFCDLDASFGAGSGTNVTVASGATLTISNTRGVFVKESP